jgi:hypothetical protein
MDEADLAQHEIEHTLRGQILVATCARQVESTGMCLNCGELLPAGQRWCDAGCRDDWTKLNETAFNGKH